MEVIIYGRIQDSLLDKQFHLSPLGSLHALPIWRHLVKKVGSTKNLQKLQRVISVSFPDWPFLHAELA